MPNHFKVGVTNPMAYCGLGAGKEVVEDSDFMAKKHKTVYQVGANETSTTGDQDTLSVGRRKEFNRREASEGCV